MESAISMNLRPTVKKLIVQMATSSCGCFLGKERVNISYLNAFQLLLVVGAKLEHIITELAHEVAEKHSVVEGNLIVTPSDDLFWFHRPKIVLVLIHFILFQNAFEIAYFFWILVSVTSCVLSHLN